jgi:hypothetical protein
MASPGSHRPREKDRDIVERTGTRNAPLSTETDSSLEDYYKSWYHSTTCECGCGGAGKNWIAQQREKNKK